MPNHFWFYFLFFFLIFSSSLSIGKGVSTYIIPISFYFWNFFLFDFIHYFSIHLRQSLYGRRLWRRRNRLYFSSKLQLRLSIWNFICWINVKYKKLINRSSYFYIPFDGVIGLPPGAIQIEDVHHHFEWWDILIWI